MTRARHIRLALAAALTLASATASGCGEDQTAIDFELVSDPNVNSTAQVAGAIDSVLVILDSADGLYAPADAMRVGNVQIRNADADPDDLELVALVAVPAGRLPVIRLLQGGLPDVPLDVRVIGVRGPEDGPAIALGHLGGARFDATHVTTATVPFNIRPELLPPRVVDVLPRDGDPAPGCDITTLVVMFSKPMDAASLMAPGRILTEPGGMPTEVTVDSSGLVALVVPASLAGVDGTIAYRLTVSSEARDRDGLALDQQPMQDGAQGFTADFVLGCSMPTMTPDPQPCGGMGLPGSPPVWCPGGGRLACIAGECVLGSCDRAQCGPGFVCDPVTFACTADCRPYGHDVCPVGRATCDDATGACH